MWIVEYKYESKILSSQFWKLRVKTYTSDIHVNTSDIRMTYEYIRVTYEWHTSTYEWHTDDIPVTCRMLCLNPREWGGEHLTSQLSLAATWLLVTSVSPVCLVDYFSPCALWPLKFGLMLVLFTFFGWWGWFYFYGELMLF